MATDPMKRVPPELTVALLTLSGALASAAGPSLRRRTPRVYGRRQRRHGRLDRALRLHVEPIGRPAAPGDLPGRTCRQIRCSSPTWAARRAANRPTTASSSRPSSKASRPWALRPTTSARAKRPSAPTTSARSPGGCTFPSSPRMSSRRTASRWPSRCGSSRRAGVAWRSSACSVRSMPRPGCASLRPARRCCRRCGRRRALRGGHRAGLCAGRRVATAGRGAARGDVVVGGPTGQPVAPRHLGPTLVLSATRQGKFLARLDPPPDAKQPWTGGIVELSERFADDPAQVANVAEFRQELGRRDIAAADTSFGPRLPLVSPKEFAVAGTKTCLDCHKPEAQAWNKSRHARAWKSLEEHGPRSIPTASVATPRATVCPAGSSRSAAVRRGSRWAAKTVMAPAGSTSASRRSTRAISPRRRINASPATITRTARGSTSMPIGPRSGTARTIRTRRSGNECQAYISLDRRYSHALARRGPIGR